MDKKPRGRKKETQAEISPDLHISEKKIHEGIFMFVKQSEAERDSNIERTFFRSFVDVHFFFSTTEN
jgi:hypothetical protein